MSKIKKTEEKTQKQLQQPVSSVRSYFTEDINKRISEMTIPQMFAILKDVPDSETWIAILKYNQERMLFSQSTLFSADPFKDQTLIARQQGIMLGMSDLQNAIINLVTPEDDLFESPTEQG